MNILTSSRVMYCFVKPGSYIRCSSVPYDLIDTIDTISSSTLVFRVKTDNDLPSSYVTFESLDPSLRQQQKGRPNAALQFEHLKNADEVEQIVREQMTQKAQKSGMKITSIKYIDHNIPVKSAIHHHDSALMEEEEPALQPTSTYFNRSNSR
jgi:hypothetical protein